MHIIQLLLFCLHNHLKPEKNQINALRRVLDEDLTLGALIFNDGHGDSA